MSALLAAAAAGLPVLAGWSVHAMRMSRRIEAARRDPLTGLWTREAFEARAARALTRRSQAAVVLVDLDGFKAVNDQHGHAVGDAVIRAAAGGITEVLTDHPGAVAGRLGGDEFAAVVPVADPAVAPWLADALHGIITAPFQHSGRDLTIGASIGLALTSDLPADHGDALAGLLRLADEAMYAVKQSGGGWQHAGFAPRCGTTAGRRTGRPGAHTMNRREAA
ncbi:GGDEF domain-containing protein [Streptomyces sp. NPDC001037]|uniref:GGDEF domain-containing protein n=1 Tax=Streptomyces sp. NPDC001037 TaxID=3364542 RepID=UPI0036BEBFA6